MAKTLNLDASVVFEKNYNAVKSDKRIISNRGGSRSTKTYTILQLSIILCFEQTGREYDIIRKTLPSLRHSAYKDFIDILRANDLYNEKDHNKSDLSYEFRGNLFSFFSINDAQKVRGRKRDIAFLNEANELSLEDFRQVSLRTNDKIFLDYNPSDEDVWIYDIEARPDAVRIDSTYLDNPFLSKGIIGEIEMLKTDDPDYWRVYGLGQIGRRREVIFTNWDVCDTFPDNCSEVIYGMDFGYNDPKVLVKIGRRGNELYIDEKLYERELLRADLISRMDDLVHSRSAEIYADSEDPETIAEISNAGWNIHPANKGKDSVISGIELLKSFKVFITGQSANIIRDWKNYKWRIDRNGRTLDEPAHAFSHSPDAVRYPVFTHWGAERTLRLSFAGASY